MIRFFHMDKSHKDAWLPRLFDLLYSNMEEITYFNTTYYEAERRWISEVSPALEKDPRQILLCLQNDSLIGYLQYYIRDDLIMVEELQISKRYQRTLLFLAFCKQILRLLPPQVAFVEAYADRRNLYSQRLMKRLGMACIGAAEGEYLHFRGALADCKNVMRIS